MTVKSALFGKRLDLSLALFRETLQSAAVDAGHRMHELSVLDSSRIKTSTTPVCDSK